MNDMGWQAEGACNGVSPDLFFPSRGESYSFARRVCMNCPVRPVCLEHGLNERYGFWGGLSERERRRLRRQREAAEAGSLAESA